MGTLDRQPDNLYAALLSAKLTEWVAAASYPDPLHLAENGVVFNGTPGAHAEAPFPPRADHHRRYLPLHPRQTHFQPPAAHQAAKRHTRHRAA